MGWVWHSRDCSLDYECCCSLSRLCSLLFGDLCRMKRTQKWRQRTVETRGFYWMSMYDLLPFAWREPKHAEFSANSYLNVTFFTLNPPCQQNVRMMHSHLDVCRHIFHVESVIFQSVRDTVSNMWKSSSLSQTLCQLQLSPSQAALFLFSVFSGSPADLHPRPGVHLFLILLAAAEPCT